MSGSQAQVPADAPFVVTTPGAAFLAFAGGEVWEADLGSARRLAVGVVATAPPVSGPDGRALLVPTAAGVEVVDTATGSHRRLLKATGVSSIASSRDGNYLTSSPAVATRPMRAPPETGSTPLRPTAH